MITYRNALKDDLKEIAKVHTLCFEGYFLSSLGEHLLQKYYECYISENAPFIIATNEYNEIIGFCMGYITGSKARNNFESNYKWKLILRLLVLCIKLDKQALDRVHSKICSICHSIINKKTNHAQTKNPNNLGSLLSICVMPQFRGTEIASTLLKEFENQLNKTNITKYTLSVYKTNARAIGFYKKMGFKNISFDNTTARYLKEL